ncbi:MAG TPA: glycosyltransferase [Opitutaceae bacterium]|nr:glycosyltransferase [Opitutaceae bacterium]
MKILIVQDYLRSGGTERQSIFLAEAFFERSHDVTLLTFRPGGQLAEWVSPKVKRLVLQRTDRKLDWWAPGLARVAGEIAPDIVLCMGRMANCWAGRIARAVRARGLRTRVIATMRTGKHLPWLYRRSLHQADHVVANSRDSMHVLIDRYGVPADKVSVIYNAIVALPHPAGEMPSERPREVVMLHVGMFRPEKNQRELIEICRELPRDFAWQLELAGAGEELENCHKLVRDYGLQDRVTFAGYSAQPQQLYQHAAVAVMASKSESLSNFLIEAHVHGVPSVSYRAAGVDECGGIAVPAGDRNAFRSALLPLLTDPSYRARESVRVREFALKHFSPATQTAEYLQLFEKLLS